MSTADAWSVKPATALLVLSDGSVIEGDGLGATGISAGEVCFNTAMTGYQEILTDPSYAGQIITFTFPHIGNVGANDEDVETVNMASESGIRGCVLNARITDPANYRSAKHLDAWLTARGIVGISGVDTRALTALIRERGVPNAVIAHDPDGNFDVEALKAQAAAWPGLEGMDLAKGVSTTQQHPWSQTAWKWDHGYGEAQGGAYKVVALDFGIKRNILRLLTEAGCEVTVLPAETSAEDVLAHQPDGVFLSNGPGDPAATGTYATKTIKTIIETGIPTFGICLGHQMMALALGGTTVKMHQGHHGANHPVKDNTTGKVEITSMNHGFAVDGKSLPDNVEETHVSLFDGSNCGLRVTDKPAFSVQYHPEASPGPQDSHYLFKRFTDMMSEARS
ncbi:carbamoyl-phosphate synthase small subunit [Roseibium hamelinense]|uniref:Carbamoyl phosphate synthase small chain n=1 Tax=Roseibium hamelinense TaxID=150831 RepID=A0A562T8Z8_9HYPH|nr:glutamine-hydrolyzing carbamoyl-phosphate synthase small subunit [Roseibium hamelinense]MTI45564.1 carbamoyl-phosphate synthase small subunit [Roseibium hamelinense]TWI90059.1 carbamoyl-phosphate synthase small subunit [Roseibium hamelinense]